MDQQQSPVQGMVADLQMCKTTLSSNITTQGPSRVNKRHFSTSNISPSTDLCVHAKVAIGGVNLLPEVGLYNGARGEIVDFNYHPPPQQQKTAKKRDLESCGTRFIE